MSAAANRDLVDRFIEAVNSKNLTAFDDIMSDDYIQHDPQGGQGRDGARQFFMMLYAAFPDLHIVVNDVIAEDDKVAIRWTMTGTQQGALMGMPPTGRSVAVNGADFWRTANGQAVEHWDTVDNLGMMQQLGVIPAPGQHPG